MSEQAEQLVGWYKVNVAKVDVRDFQWDSLFWMTNLKAAEYILSRVEENHAREFICNFGYTMSQKGYFWTLETAARHIDKYVTIHSKWGKKTRGRSSKWTS